MKIVCVVNWPEQGRWIWDDLPNSRDEVRIVSLRAPKDRFPGWGKFLSYYPSYVLQAWHATQAASDAEMIVAWEAKNGLPLAVIRRLLGRPSGKLVILNFCPRGPVASLPRVMEWGLSAVDFLTCLSRSDMALMQERYHIPDSRIGLLAFPSTSRDDQWRRLRTQTSPGNYVLASGRSFRDYGTLLRAVEGLNVPVRILARQFNMPRIPIPSNVEFSELLPLNQYYAAMLAARIVVVPLVRLEHSAGESHVVDAMAAGKPIVVTDSPSIRDYVQHGENGLLVPPGDANAMRRAIQHLLDNPSEAEQLARNARNDYETKYEFSRRSRKVNCLLHSIVGNEWECCS